MYERYRELIHNDFRGLDQKTALNEIKTEESFERQMSKKASKGRPGQVEGFYLFLELHFSLHIRLKKVKKKNDFL